MKYLKFQEAILKEFCKKTGTDFEEMNKKFQTDYSYAKFDLLKDQAIQICENSRYFPLRKRLFLARYIIFGK